MTWVVLFVFGLLIGSFLNVVGLRYRENDRIIGTHVTHGRSQCMSCKVSLRWYELVPLFSFLAQGAKCRHCKHSLSWQYPFVEFITAGLTAVIPWQLQEFYASWHSANPQLVGWLYVVIAAWLLVSCTAIVICIIDVRLRIIPDQANILLAICGLVLLAFRHLTVGQVAQPYFAGAYAPVFGSTTNPFISVIVALLFVFALFGGAIYFSKGRGMGMGDLKLAAALAIILGWPDILIAVMSAFIIGSLIGLALIANRSATMKATVPFGPFLIVGLYVAMFYGESILRWYFSAM